MKAWHWFLIGLLSVIGISNIVFNPEISGEATATYVIIGGLILAVYYFMKPKSKDKILMSK